MIRRYFFRNAPIACFFWFRLSISHCDAIDSLETHYRRKCATVLFRAHCDCCYTQFTFWRRSDNIIIKMELNLICGFCHQPINVLTQKIFASYCGIALHEQCMVQVRQHQYCVCGQQVDTFFQMYLNLVEVKSDQPQSQQQS